MLKCKRGRSFPYYCGLFLNITAKPRVVIDRAFWKQLALSVCAGIKDVVLVLIHAAI